MIKSMTGYGKGQSASSAVTMTVEVRSVNHRYCDVTIKSPRSLLALDGEVRKRVTARLGRGKVDVFINQESTASSAVLPTINRPLVEAYINLFEEMRNSFAVDGGIPLSLLVAQKDVVVLREGEVELEVCRKLLDEALVKALDAIDSMRRVEGEAVGRDIEGRLEAVGAYVDQVEARAPSVPREWQEKLLERLSRLNSDLAYDPQRVAQEVAIFADRCDISEEIVRFRSHVQQFRALYASEEPVGRQMDFLVQEMNREVNTMGSKSNDAELTRTVVAIKAELEKIREQVQNVE